ncbi:tRNA lysidine(34) synthetase TilS [Peribacillus muralis]|uniref:tRNA lysidine(34) synthetase TilS n=1 Tax=Peribacillus muralis TaxID=264697 RepID=UPI001F4ED78C|nr:tRNA lysidine(34) synthetase TilS [Peribacillus muralis]MCK1995427.1 tRNA lysidine(34) synthetase TilS [Peribacillus muralis]MCK2016010.1 tRNA lysidine(34) synthetase TilS [Peribacillus muralis]
MLKEKVLNTIYRNGLIEGKTKLLIGVSGGPDSMVLLHILKEIQPLFQYEMLVASVDHMFRGEESYEDYQYVEQICARWGIAFEGKRIDVPARMKHTGESSQITARKLRFAFYEEMMDKHQASTLVLGHHGDDQVETMLMRLTRGATGKARAGIPIKRRFHTGQLIRPFLEITKSQIMEYANLHNIAPRFDPSNDQDDYVRNRFRHEVLPFLKQENGKVHEHFQRFSEELYQDEAFFLDLVSREMSKVWIQQDEDQAVIKIDKVLAMPKPLQRRAIQLILNYLYLERPSSLSALHIDQLLVLFFNPQPSAELHLPEGLIAEKSYQTCTFRFFRQKSQEYSLKLQIPGETILPNGYKIKAHYIKEEIPVLMGNHSFILPESAVQFPLTVRTRKEGERMAVKGLGGTKKLKDIFINEKIPMQERNVWPVIIDQAGTAIWLPGLKKSDVEPDMLSDETSLIYLEYKKA